MKKEMIFVALVLLMTSMISAEIIINNQPKATYNLGETIPVSMTVKATQNISGYFYTLLMCEGKIKELSKIPITLDTGSEKKIEFDLRLNRETIEEMKGKCKMKGFIDEDYILSNEFQISNELTIKPDMENNEFDPGENILIDGEVFRKTGGNAEGFINLELREINNSIIEQLGTISNGYFSINITLPSELRAGEYLIRLYAYELDSSGKETNTGTFDKTILIRQMPTSVEILLETFDIEPGTNAKVTAILHDQTGDPINSTAMLTIKNSQDRILDQKEIQTGEYIEYAVNYNQAPEEWKAYAISNKITGETTFNILEKKDVNMELVNETLVITNVGNVIYNDTILVKIGTDYVHINVTLDVDGEQKYKLTAPEGEYQVEVIADGEDPLTQSMVLTGRAIDVKISNARISIYPIVWIFVILVLGLIAFFIFKKGYRKTFFGKLSQREGKKKDEPKSIPLKKGSLISTRNKAELSLSIKGDKQKATVLCIKIKNLEEIESKENNASETIQKIIRIAEGEKAAIYENNDNLFIIFAPAKTRTFKNEKTAFKIAEGAEKILKEHNKLFSQKIKFGISLNNGEIIAKEEKDALKFMSIGTLITISKKLATMSKEEILLGETIEPNLKTELKTSKHEEGHTKYYKIEEVKQNKEEHKKFIDNFVKNLEKEKSK